MQKEGDWFDSIFMVFNERVNLKTLGAFLGGNMGVEFDFIMAVEGSLLAV